MRTNTRLQLVFVILCGSCCGAQLYHSLRFEPPTVDFGAWSVGTAHSQLVTLINQNSNRSVYLSSVSAKTADFYSSFFESKVVPPMGNTTFSVVFLPRGNGAVAADLLIHTSFGQTHLLVRGEGRECPYHLKPIVGIKAPLNATLSPEIHMYNPHGRPLQILEVYSSGGQFQLELPSGGHEGPQVLWEIPPHSTKPVIRIRFHGQSVGNYTAYIRIKISEHQGGDSETAKENMLVVPVEFNILADHGLYAENPLLDFGRITTDQNAPIKIKLQLQNSHTQRAFELDPEQWQNVRGLSFNASDATVSLDPQLFESSYKLEEVMLLRSNEKRDGNNVSSSKILSCEFSVIIRADIYKGTLAFNRNTSIFVTQSSNYMRGEKRNLIVRNNFDIPLTLHSIDLQHEDAKTLQMEIMNINSQVLAPGASLTLLQLSVLNDSANFESSLRIFTNITNFEVPVVICTGHIHVSAYDSNTLISDAIYNLELDLGAIPLAKMSHFGYIIMHNRNSIAVRITTWDFKSAQGVYFHASFMGCLRTSALRAFRNGTNVPLDNAKFKFCSHLQAGDVAVIQVAIQSYVTEQDRQIGSLKIWTPYEEIDVRVKFHTWLGKLEVDQEQLYFNNCFPGKMCTAQLAIRSTFKYPIQVKSVNFDADGLRFEDLNSQGSTIIPESVTTIGRIYLEPAQLCQQRCYIPQEDVTRLLAFPTMEKTKGGANNNLHFDEAELRRRTELYRQLKWYYQTISFTLNSVEVRQFQMQLTIDLEWPKLVAGVQTMPTIEVGNEQELSVIINNPANSAILIDYFLADPKYAKETQLSLPLEVIDASSNCYLTDKAAFSLPNGMPKQQLLLPAQTNVSVPLHFKALEPDSYCTLLHIRNNLTLYEAVWITAKTVQSQFRFGNRKPGSNTPLLFEVNEKVMAVCEHQKQQESVDRPPVTVKRSFTARNTGEISIRVDGFLIGDQPCEGYGFRIIDCNGFDLKANASKKIEIVFNPDFTSTRVSRPLILLSNLSYEIKYALLAQLSSTHLDKCNEIQRRPVWEPRIRNAAILLLATTFIFVLIAAHIDYGNILVNQSVLYAAREKGPIHHFNLRNIVATKEHSRPTIDEQSETRFNASAVTIKTITPSVIANTNVANINCQHQHNKTPQQSPNSNNNNYGSNPNNTNLRKRIPKSKSQQQSLSDESWTLQQLSAALKDTITTTLTQTPTGVKVSHMHQPNERGSKTKSEGSGSNSSSTPTSESSPNPLSVNDNNSSGKTVTAVPIKIAHIHQSKEVLQNMPNNSNAGTSGSASAGGKKKQQRDLKKNKGASNAINVNDRIGIPPMHDKSAVRLTKFSDKTSYTAADTLLPLTSSPTNDVVNVVNEVIKTKLPSPIVSGTENKETNGARQKIGKTPGRERKKDTSGTQSQPHYVNNDVRINSVLSSSSSSSSCSSSSTNSKRAERKQKAKSVNALNFQALSNNDIRQNISPFTASVTPQWDAMNQVSFSKVLQQTEKPSYALDLKGGQGPQLHHMDTNISTRQQQQQNELNLNTELGPIGSKKSPCATPAVWEPIACDSPTAAMGDTTQHLPQTLISSNSSFFSNMLPNNFNSTDFVEHQQLQQLQQQQQQQYMNAPTTNSAVNLYEVEYLLNMRQQHIQAQQQQQQQQLLQCTDSNGSLNWNSSSAWSPMNYEQNTNSTPGVITNTLGSFAPLQVGWQHSLNGTGICGGNSGVNPTVMRPPPGLEASIPGVGHHSMQSSGHNASVRGQAESNMQTFDPFSSLSSIWNDNWNKRQQNSHKNNN